MFIQVTDLLQSAWKIHAIQSCSHICFYPDTDVVLVPEHPAEQGYANLKQTADTVVALADWELYPHTI